MNKTLSDTPETDAMVVTLPKRTERYATLNDKWVAADFARSLERRLAAASQGHNVCEGQLQDLKDRLREAEQEVREACARHLELKCLHIHDPIRLANAIRALDLSRSGINNG